MRENSATERPELLIECPNCDGTGWVQAISDWPGGGLTVACPACAGRSWTAAVSG